MKDIYILVIDNDNGLTSSAFATEALAYASLYEYVRDNWSTVYGLPPIPEDPNTAIRTYFDSDNCEERGEIQAATVQGESDKPIEHGDEFIMPDPVADLGDAWRLGGWVGSVVGFRDDPNGEKLVTVEDVDGDAYDIELDRLVTCERA